ncbi:MAG: ATP-binding domain-containing protein, partial [Fibrobacteres bacterium]|nr:ATP-binding domain-containing protein [Fibrobacterota bacterium]
EVEFQRKNIPYKVPGGGGFYDRKEVKNLIAYLMFIANPLDELSLSRILKTPSWHVSRDAMKNLESDAGSRKCSLWDVFQISENENVAKFTQFIKKHMTEFKRAKLPDAFREMVADLKYREYLNDLYADRKEEAAKRIAVINELEHSVALFAKGRKKADLSAYLLEVQMMMNEKDEDDNRDSVTLMTLHSSKGMEFPVIFLPGLDDEVMPSKRSVDEGNIEEERRLFYVGITRAQKRLYLSWPGTRFLYNKHRPVKFCRFISDIPENLLAAPIGKREAENRETALADFFKSMQEKLKNGMSTNAAS